MAKAQPLHANDAKTTLSATITNATHPKNALGITSGQMMISEFSIIRAPSMHKLRRSDNGNIHTAYLRVFIMTYGTLPEKILYNGGFKDPVG